MINPYFLILLLPIIGYVILRSENVNFDRKKLFSGFFIILLLAITPSFYFEPAFATDIANIIKIQEDYPADSAFVDVPLPIKLIDLDSAFVFISFSHTGESDQSDTSRRWVLLNETTLRIFGEDTATGNIEENMVIYIIEFSEDENDFDVQHLQLTTTTSEAGNTKFVAIPTPVNASQSFVIFRGLSNNASETSWGDEEFGEVQLNNTHVGFELTAIPNTGPQQYGFSVVTLNNTDFVVQRGNGSFTGASTSVSPPVDVNRDHTLLLVTYRPEIATSANADDMLIRAQLDTSSPPDIVFNRDTSSPTGTIHFNWELLEFPSDVVNVTHGTISMGSGVTIATDTLASPVFDFERSIVISGVGSPYGYGTGAPASGTEGAIDRGMARILLTDQDEITATREDGTFPFDLDYQVIEFLETEIPENPTGTNTLRQIVNFNGTSTESEQTIIFSPALEDITKAFMFYTGRPVGAGDLSGGSAGLKLINTTAIKIFRNQDPTVTSVPAQFFINIIEFDSSSSISVQHERLNYAGGMTNGEKIMHMNPVNVTNAHTLSSGQTLTGQDGTIGSEEFFRVRILSSNTWGYDVEQFQNFGTGDGTTINHLAIVDWNQDDIFVQRGQVDMAGLTVAGVSPSIPIVQNRTMLLFSSITGSGDFTDSPATATVSGTINSTNQIEFTRDSSVDGVGINWETITFPENFVLIQHGTHHQNAGTSSLNSTILSVNLDNTFVTGTGGGSAGWGIGRSDNSTEINESFANAISQVILVNDTTVEITRSVSTSSFDIGFQVVEFLAVGVQETFNVADAIVLVDNFNSNLTSVATLPETVDILDLFASNLTIAQGFTDTVSLLDVFSSEISGATTLPEAIDITDTFITELTALEDFTDAIIISDVFNVNQEFVQDLSDTITILDVFSAQIQGAPTFPEVITIIDVFNETLLYIQNFPESILLTDVFTATLTANYNAIDTLDILDAFVATCATCQTTTPPPPTSGSPISSGGSPTSPFPFGQSPLVDLQIFDKIIDVTPGEIIDLTLEYNWSVDSEIQIVLFDPERNKWFSINLPVIEESTGIIPNEGEIPFSFRLPLDTCQTQGDFDDQNCYESNFIQIPITVSGVSDGRLSSDTGVITVRVISGVEIPVIYYIISGLVLLSIIISWWIIFGRNRHSIKGDRLFDKKHTQKQHRDKESRRNDRNKVQRKGSLKDRLNSRPDNFRSRRPTIVRKRKTIG